MNRSDAESEAEAGVQALQRLNVEATGGVYYAYDRFGGGGWRSFVKINGRTAGQLALEVRAARGGETGE